MATSLHDVRDFWKMRAKAYNQLGWATSSEYEKRYLDAAAFQKTDKVLDAGCGTGIITKLIAPHVTEIVGLDISQDMLVQTQKDAGPNETYVLGDMTAMPFLDASFDKVSARMVLHHLMEKAQVGVNESYRVLKPGGEIIVSEGIPPDEAIAEWYTEMFKLKEERITFSYQILTDLLKNAGFRDVHVDEYWLRQTSIKNWLVNSGISKENQDTIMRMHREMPEIGKKLYNAKITDDDVRIDMLFLILVGVKEGMSS